MSQPSCGVCSAPSDSQLCARCYTTLERNIGELPALWDELIVTRTKQDALGLGVIGGEGHASPLPINLGATFDADALRGTLVSWVITIADDDGIDDTPAGTVQAMAVWLVSYLGWARRSDEAAQFHDEIGYIIGVIRRAIDRPEERIYYGPCKAVTVITETGADGAITVRQGPCPGQLYGRPDQDELKCDGYAQPELHLGRTDEQGNRLRGCGATDSVEARLEYLRAEAEDRLAPLDVLLDSLKRLGIPEVTKRAARKWIARKQLGPHGVDLHGVELFRGGDVFWLAEQAKSNPRPGAKGRARDRISA